MEMYNGIFTDKSVPTEQNTMASPDSQNEISTKCVICGKLILANYLITHVRICGIKLKCNVCNMQFMKYPYWSTHVEKCNFDSLHCGKCGKKMKGLREVSRHMIKCTGKRYTVPDEKCRDQYIKLEQLNMELKKKCEANVLKQSRTSVTGLQTESNLLNSLVDSIQSNDELYIDAGTKINKQGDENFPGAEDKYSSNTVINEIESRWFENDTDDLMESEMVSSDMNRNEQAFNKNVVDKSSQNVHILNIPPTAETPIPCLVLVPHTQLASNDKNLAKVSNETDGESRNSVRNDICIAADEHIPESEYSANDICESLDGSLTTENLHLDGIENKQEQCDRCLDTFYNRKQFQNHLIKCNRYKCIGCQVIIYSESNRIAHFRICRKYKDAHMTYIEQPRIEENGNCPHCGKIVSLSEENFLIHQTTCNSTIKTCKNCPLCGKYFTSQFMLLMHCNKYCYRSFRGNSFPCGMCSYNNSNQINTLTHIKDIHKNEISGVITVPSNTFACCKCGELFQNDENCKVHVKSCVQ